MADHKVSVGDETAAAADLQAPQAPAPELKKYEVVAEDGIFKNGKTYKKGQKVELNPNTAASFIEAGDVKEAK